MTFNGNISDMVGALTLSANSTIDMDGGNISLTFASLASALTRYSARDFTKRV